MHPTYDSKNQWLYFSSDRPQGYGGMDLYRVRFNQNGIIGELENMGIDINTDSDEVFPYVYNDDVLFYSSNQKLGLGNLDPFMANRLIENRWSIEPLGVPFSSEEDDFGFYLDPKTKLGFISSNRKGGAGNDDNYYFVSKPKVKGVEDRYIFGSDTLVKSFDGVLKNDEFLMLSEDPLNSLVEKEVFLYQTPNNGTVDIQANGSFWYLPKGPEIKKDTFSYYLETSYSKTQPINVYLEREKSLKNEPLIDIEYVFRPIYFEFDSADVWKKYIDRIDEVIAALNLYPNMEVKVKAYTDRRGKNEYNLRLSDGRSKSIVAYIKSRIKNPNRITGVGYGESLVKIKDTRIKVSKEEHQKERRVEFEVNNFQFFKEDKISGTIPIFERPSGKQIKILIDENLINYIHIHSIDRCARNVKSLLEFIEYCSERGVNVYFKKEGLNTLGEDGNTSYMVKLMITIMGAFGEVENEIRAERQKEGIQIAKDRGRYDNRIKRGKETPQRFLMKHSKAVDYLKMGMKGSEVIRLLDGKINKNTITKIRKYISNEIYDGIKGREYVEGLKQQPVVSSMEFADLMSD